MRELAHTASKEIQVKTRIVGHIIVLHGIESDDLDDERVVCKAELPPIHGVAERYLKSKENRKVSVSSKRCR